MLSVWHLKLCRPLLLGILAISTLSISAAQPPVDNRFKPFPPEIAAAWKAIGAQPGWLKNTSGNLAWQPDDPQNAGGLPAFRIARRWKDGQLAKFPLPEKPFGIALTSPLITRGGLKELASLTNLQALDLHEAQGNDTTLKDVAKLTGLHALNLGGNTVSDQGIRELKSLVNLQELYLGSTQITDAAFKQLAGFKNLQTLNLTNTKVTNAGLRDIGKIISLHELNLSTTRITDAGLKEIAGLAELQTLYLLNCRITDKGLPELANLKNLKELHLSLDPNNTLLTPAGAQQLQKALPGCRITPY